MTYSKKAFFDKVEWEGGYYAVADYGIRPETIKDKKIKEIWIKYIDLYEQMENLELQLDKLQEN